MELRPTPIRAWRIIYVPVTERRGGLFPLLILRNGKPSVTAALWARALDRENWSDSKIEAHLRALGAFHSYCLAKQGGANLNQGNLYGLVCDFAEARFRGTYDSDGNDPCGLFWSRVHISGVVAELRAINRYSDFVAHYLDLPPLNPAEQGVARVAMHYVSAKEQGRSDAMVHLRGIRKRPRRRRPFELHRRTAQRQGLSLRPKYIAPDVMVELVDKGCVNPRDKMLLLLLGYAGMRISEPLHLFVSDVMQTFRETRAAKIRLEHPSHGHTEWVYQEKRFEGARSRFLEERFGRLPRNELGRGHREFSGWKGMLLAEGDPSDRYAFWLEEETMGVYFRALLEEYLDDHKRLLLSGRATHPYLFFNIRRTKAAGYGEPLTLANAHEIFNSAASRVGFRLSPHGCRHHYGFYAADILSLTQETLMRMMHHASIVSTDTYFRISPDTIRSHIGSIAVTEVKRARPSFPSSWRQSWARSYT